jgi:hypothetical protein
VTIVSLYELTGAMGSWRWADADWRPFKIEAYLFIAAIYFAFCFSMSRYSLWVEKQVNKSLSKNRYLTPWRTHHQFDKLNKWYGNNFHVLRDIDLSTWPRASASSSAARRARARAR